MRKLIPSLALTIALGAAGFAGILSGCNDSNEKGNLLTNPDQAYSDKGASTLGVGDPVPADEEEYNGVCDEAAADAAEVCASITFHQISPPASYSKYVIGKHITTKVNYSKYDIGGGVTLEHIKTGINYSKYTKSKTLVAGGVVGRD